LPASSPVRARQKRLCVTPDHPVAARKREVDQDNPGKACIKQMIGNSIQGKPNSPKGGDEKLFGQQSRSKIDLSMVRAKKRFFITHN